MKPVIACPHRCGCAKGGLIRIYDVEVYIFSGEQGKLDSITVVAQALPRVHGAALVKRWYDLGKPKRCANLPKHLLKHFN